MERARLQYQSTQISRFVNSCSFLYHRNIKTPKLQPQNATTKCLSNIPTLQPLKHRCEWVAGVPRLIFNGTNTWTVSNTPLWTILRFRLTRRRDTWNVLDNGLCVCNYVFSITKRHDGFRNAASQNATQSLSRQLQSAYFCRAVERKTIDRLDTAASWSRCFWCASEGKWTYMS